MNVRIVNLDRLTYAGNLDSLAAISEHPSYSFVHGDIGDTALVKSIFDTHRPTAVVHLAAETHVDRSIDGPAPFVMTNVLGTVTLLEAALQYWQGLSVQERDGFRFLHVSTDEVYGALGSSGKFREDSPYQPNSPYAASKAAADHFVRAFHQTYGLPVLLSHCSNNYGPYQFPEKLIPLVILNAIEGKPLPVYGDGQQVRDWLHVEDHCEALEVILQQGSPGEVYNVGGNCEKANIEVVRMICELVDGLRPDLPHSPCSKLITHVEDRLGHDRRYAIDIHKIHTELGWQPKIDFDSGLQQTVRWYLENSGWVERVASGSYRRERLGLSRPGAMQ